MRFNEYVRNLQDKVISLPGPEEDKSKVKAALAYAVRPSDLYELRASYEFRLSALEQAVREAPPQQKSQLREKIEFLAGVIENMQAAKKS